MKIGLVTAEYAPMQGGVGDFTREVGRALAALGHEAHVVTNLKSQIPNTQGDEGRVHVERIMGGNAGSGTRGQEHTATI